MAAEDYPVIFASVADMLGATTTPPSGSEVAARYLSSDPGSDLPVVSNLLVNGDVGLVGIVGDPTGITTDTLGG